MLKKLILLVLLPSFYALASCSGDCRSCHFNLDYKKDARHKPMLECKSCHNTQSTNTGTGCGQDCFVCHSVEKIRLPELKANHKVIDDCINCHKGLSQSLLTPNVGQKGGQNIFEQSLKDYSNGLKIAP